MKTEGKRNLLRQPDEIRLMTGGAQTEQETAPDAAAFRAGDVTVELAEADGSLAVFVQAQNTPVRELVLTWKAMFGGAARCSGTPGNAVTVIWNGKRKQIISECRGTFSGMKRENAWHLV